MTDNDLKLKQALDELPGNIEPERDLWPGIEHAINKRPAVYYKPAWALAASVAIVFLFSLAVLFIPRQSSVNPELLQVLATLQEDHQNTKQTLLVRYQERQPSYPDWQREMQQLEEAEAVLYEALQEEPGNMTLITMLRQVQNKQIELLNIVYTPRLTTL